MERKVLVFSIGNPGPLHRHSVGHWALGKLVKYYDGPQLQRKGKYSESKSSDGQVTFIKSNTSMNESNMAFKTAIQSISADTIVLVIHDDFEAKLGKVRKSRFKNSESHNGLKSIQKSLASLNPDNVYKLGIGIGPKPTSASRETMSSWVLSKFTPDETAMLDDVTLPLLISSIAGMQDT